MIHFIQCDALTVSFIMFLERPFNWSQRNVLVEALPADTVDTSVFENHYGGQ